MNGLVIVGHWFLASLVERTINQTLLQVWGRKDEDETKVVRGREERRRSRAIFQAEIRQRRPFSLLRRPLTRITVASSATLKRWTSGREWRQGRLFRRRRTSTESLRLLLGDQKRGAEAVTLLSQEDVPAHPPPRPGLWDIYVVHLARKTRSPSRDGYVTVILRCQPGKST